MMNLMEVLQHRRSVRKYTGEHIPEEALRQVLQAGLLSPSGRARRPWEFIVVRNRDRLDQLARSRVSGAGMLSQADCAIVVLGDEHKTDVWVEDCSIAMYSMHLMADALGLGSCWVQGRLRSDPEGQSTEENLRKLLHFPEYCKLEAILALGIPQSHPAPQDLASLEQEKIHLEQF